MSENKSQNKSEKWEPSLKRYSACSSSFRLSRLNHSCSRRYLPEIGLLIQSNAVMRLDRVMLFTGRHNIIIKRAGRSFLFLILRQGEEQASVHSLRQAENMDSSLLVQTIPAMDRWEITSLPLLQCFRMLKNDSL